MSEEPKTLLEAIQHFSVGDNAFQTLVRLRWPSGVCCPTCGRLDVRYVSTRKIWECKEIHSKRQFSCRVGTIFEDSPLGLDKWFSAVWMIANCKNGVSSYELSRSIGVTQKTAWFILHRIRIAMETGSFMKPDNKDGEYETDETFFGGKAKFMHKDRKKRVITGGGVSGKEVVVGVLRRGDTSGPSQVTAEHVPDRHKETLKRVVKNSVPEGAAFYTDALAAYREIGKTYRHEYVDHPYQYVNGRCSTNGIENFWSILKRAAKGTYVRITPKHLDSYVQEGVFRYNRRRDNDLGRFKLTLVNAIGRRLTYKDLTCHG